MQIHPCRAKAPRLRRATRVWLAAVLAFAMLAPVSRPVGANALIELFTGADEPIPRQAKQGMPYRSWSLFLVCNPAWLKADNEARLRSLYEVFQAFGSVIGIEHLAVWLRGSNDGALSFRVDTDRSAAFCASLGLAPSRSPYLVITTEYPGAGLPTQYPQGFPEASAAVSVVSLDGMQADEMTGVIGKLSDQLVLNKLAKRQVGGEEWWRALEQAYEGMRQAFVAAPKGVTMRIKSPFFEVEKKF